MRIDKFLKDNGFVERAIDCVCPNCVTVSAFIRDHPKGEYVLICDERLVPVCNGAYFGCEECADEIVISYYKGGL